MGFVEMEQVGKKGVKQFPLIKRSAKRVYQWASAVSTNEKFKIKDVVIRISLDDGLEYYYGYYDKTLWDATDWYMICCIKVKQAYKSVAPKEPGVVDVIDAQDGNKFKKLGITHCWNVHQSCMAQWVGPDYSSKIIYNDFRNGSFYTIMKWNEDAFDINNYCQYIKEAYIEKKWIFVSDYIRLKALYEYETIAFINKDRCMNKSPNTKKIQKYLKGKYKYHWTNELQEIETRLIVFPSAHFFPSNSFTSAMHMTENTYTFHHYDNTWKISTEKMKKKVRYTLPYNDIAFDYEVAT